MERRQAQAALLRHPLVQGAKGRCYGRRDLRLAPQAGAQTRRMIAALRGWHGATVWTSPARRCRIPAAAIARALGTRLRRDARLAELDFGAWEGRLWATIPRATFDAWAQDLRRRAPPCGETGQALIDRVSAFWRRLPAGRHVVVTHGGPLKVLRALAAGAPVDLASPAPPPGSVVIVRRPAR